jgi:hypothetical protein
MRTLVKVSMPVEAGNARVKDGRLQKTIQSFMAEFKPEAAYFYAENGRRTGFFVLDLKDPSQIPAVAEPWFLSLNASVEFYPAMTVEDLAKAGPAFEQCIKNYS